MKRTFFANCSPRGHGLVILVCAVVAISAVVRAEPITEENMQPIAARVGDVAAAVRSFAVREPGRAAGLGEEELYLAATAHDLRLREAFLGVLVKARPTGVVLVCTADGTRGLVEDAVCTTRVDALLWREERLCEFSLDLATICPRRDESTIAQVRVPQIEKTASSPSPGFKSGGADLPDEVLVTDYAWTDGIREREPIVRLGSPASISPLYLWIRLAGNSKALERMARGKLPLRHVWLRVGSGGFVGTTDTVTTDERDLGIAKNDEIVQGLRSEIAQKGRFDWRTWSFKRNVYPGQWAVRILYADNSPVRCLKDGQVIDDCVVTIQVAPR